MGKRLNGFPGSLWRHYDNPIIEYKNNQTSQNLDLIKKTIAEIEKDIKKTKKTACIIIEPIQCTNGDRYFDHSFFKDLRKISSKYDIPLIFDEVQTGFCVTGKKWYYHNVGVKPDILIFGKKTQLSGIMVDKKFGKIFKDPIKLEVTWDGDAVDMIRCKYIIKALKKFQVLKNVNDMSQIFANGLNNIKNIHNVRNSGLLFAFDLSKNTNSQEFSINLFKKQMLCNPTGESTVRLRPHLFVNKKEINEALNIINDTVGKIKN